MAINAISSKTAQQNTNNDISPLPGKSEQAKTTQSSGKTTSTSPSSIISITGTKLSSEELYGRPRPTQNAPDASGLAAANSLTPPAAQLRTQLHAEYPDIYKEAKQTIESRLKKDYGVAIDADNTYFNSFSEAKTSHVTYNGWEHNGPPTSSRSLTEMQMRNFPARFGEDPTELNQMTGIYTESTSGSHFCTNNEARLLSSQVKSAVQDTNFYYSYKPKLEQYWNRNFDAQQALFKANAYNTAATLQKDPVNPLSDKAMAMLSEAAGHPEPGKSVQGVKSYIFDINSYPSKDMTWYQAKDGYTVLHMPTSERAYKEYKNADEMRADVAGMTQSKAGRDELASHFSFYNRDDGVTYQGIDKWVNDIAMGGYDYRIAYQPQQIEGDIFRNQTERVRDASLDDVHRLVKTTGEVRQEELGQALDAINTVLPNPVTPFVQLGADGYEAVNDGAAQDRQQAAHRAWGDAANIGVLIVLDRIAKGKIGVDPAPNNAGSSPPNTNTRPGSQPWFKQPELINGKVGYPAGPTKPPRWPDPNGNPNYVRDLNTPPPVTGAPRPRPSSPWGSSPNEYLPPQLEPTPSTSGTNPPPLPSPGVTSPDESIASRSPNSDGSDTSGSYNPSSPVDDEVNPRANDTIDPAVIPAGGRLNRLGLIERTDMNTVYRAEKNSRIDRRGDPTQEGFRDSAWFGGVEKMVDGPAIVASRSQAGVADFADHQFGAGNYTIYQIDVSGIPVASVRENLEHNSVFFAERQGVNSDFFEYRTSMNMNMDDFGEGAYGFDEVHVANAHLGPDRISLA